jgi:hypothetical protein
MNNMSSCSCSGRSKSSGNNNSSNNLTVLTCGRDGDATAGAGVCAHVRLGVPEEGGVGERVLHLNPPTGQIVAA